MFRSLWNEISYNATQISDSLLLHSVYLLTFKSKRYPNYELSIMYHNIVVVVIIAVHLFRFCLWAIK